MQKCYCKQKILTALPLSDPGNRGGEGAECPWYAGNKDVDEGGVKGVPRARAVYRFVQPVVRMASNTKKKDGGVMIWLDLSSLVDFVE